MRKLIQFFFSNFRMIKANEQVFQNWNRISWFGRLTVIVCDTRFELHFNESHLRFPYNKLRFYTQSKAE